MVAGRVSKAQGGGLAGQRQAKKSPALGGAWGGRGGGLAPRKKVRRQAARSLGKAYSMGKRLAAAGNAGTGDANANTQHHWPTCWVGVVLG